MGRSRLGVDWLQEESWLQVSFVIGTSVDSALTCKLDKLAACRQTRGRGHNSGSHIGQSSRAFGN